MKHHQVSRRERGISLIDAMLAVVVLAGGLVAVAQFQGGLISSSAQTKARAEAVQLAQDKIDELRNLVLESQYTGLSDGQDQVTGVNASFTRAWDVTQSAADSDRTQVQVTVTWTDPQDGQQSVDLTSFVAWNDPAVSANIASGAGSGGGTISPSTGRATTVSDKTYTDDAGNLNLPDGTDNGDGTMDHVTDGGERELIDTSSGEVLLSVSDGSAFSTISGKLYFDQEVSKTPDPTEFFIMTSDAAYCTMDNTSVSSVPQGAANPSYQYFDYTCYVGAQWYGNVGVVSTDRTNNQNRVCVGDPNVAVQYNNDGTEASTSDHPALSTIRTYRGYQTDDSGLIEISLGIGMSSGSYAAAHYTNQDFLVTTITGDAVDSECGPPMEYLSPDPSPFDGNPGDFVCLTDTCPESLPTGDAPTTIFTGTITAKTDYSLPGHLGLDITAGTCSVTAQPNANNPRSYDYACEINWLGWTGGTWEGEMTTTNADVCTFTYTQPAAVTLDSGVIYLDGTYYNMIGFTNFPPEVEALSMDFTVAPTGSAPACR
ncbi:MAG TPA: hypothetical protein VKA64_06990 [Gammaproteobacteria bacterium]|nr:hypothetical protein [Gammaproteobacteria bacterium]